MGGFRWVAMDGLEHSNTPHSNSTTGPPLLKAAWHKPPDMCPRHVPTLALCHASTKTPMMAEDNFDIYCNDEGYTTRQQTMRWGDAFFWHDNIILKRVFSYFLPWADVTLKHMAQYKQKTDDSEQIQAETA